MFRFGLNREEKEMINRTIKELQELRAELSVFKHTLAGIKREEYSAAALQAAETGEPQDRGKEETGSAGEDCAVVQYGECPFLPEDRVEVEEAGGGAGEAAEEEGPAPAAGENQVRPAAASKDWAVVNLAERKRPWWKIWEPKNRIVKRSV